MAGNKLIIEKTSCNECPYKDYYYPRWSDSFDMDHIGYCTKTTRKNPNNEVGYGINDNDFPIPDWCPLLPENLDKENKND